MVTPRYKQDRTVEIDGEIPLIDPADPKQKKVAERWIANVKIFDLSDPAQLTQYTEIWQQHCDGTAEVCIEKGPDFDPVKSRYMVFIKWKTYQYIAPQVKSDYTASPAK